MIGSCIEIDTISIFQRVTAGISQEVSPGITLRDPSGTFPDVHFGNPLFSSEILKDVSFGISLKYFS